MKAAAFDLVRITSGKRCFLLFLPWALNFLVGDRRLRVNSAGVIPAAGGNAFAAFPTLPTTTTCYNSFLFRLWVRLPVHSPDLSSEGVVKEILSTVEEERRRGGGQGEGDTFSVSVSHIIISSHHIIHNYNIIHGFLLIHRAGGGA